MSRIANLGSGSTWPGHVALKIYPNFLKRILKESKVKVILVVGTNGKTTTTTMIAKVLKDQNKKVFQNNSGANLKNGVASSFIAHMDMHGQMDAEYAVFEVDENNLVPIMKDITPHTIIVLNLFRDQLDRYGELDSIASRWKIAFQKLNSKTKLILNADDALIASLGEDTGADISYFGLEDKTSNKVPEHASDSIYCPKCKTKLEYTEVYYSHLGHWHCPNCKFSRPNVELSDIKCSLPGTYNKYNALAAALCGIKENFNKEEIENTLENVDAVFGRQEKIAYKGRNIQIFLSKNPTSFNQSISTVMNDVNITNYNFLFILNDDIPDGRDISWIWDINLEEYIGKFTNVFLSGDRAYDLALRFQYAEKKYKNLDSEKYNVEKNLEKVMNKVIEKIPEGETLYILPTYSAMLNIRKILTGRKIL